MRVLIADRNPSTCSALAMLLRMDDRIRVVAAVSDVEQVLSHLQAGCCDLLLLDWDGMGSEIGAIRDVLNTLPHPPLIIGMSVRSENRQNVLSQGVTEFVYKGDPPECLKAVIRRAEQLLQP